MWACGGHESIQLLYPQNEIFPSLEIVMATRPCQMLYMHLMILLRLLGYVWLSNQLRLGSLQMIFLSYHAFKKGDYQG